MMLRLLLPPQPLLLLLSRRYVSPGCISPEFYEELHCAMRLPRGGHYLEAKRFYHCYRYHCEYV